MEDIKCISTILQLRLWRHSPVLDLPTALKDKQIVSNLYNSWPCCRSKSLQHWADALSQTESGQASMYVLSKGLLVNLTVNSMKQ